MATEIDIAISWVLYSVREVLGLEKIRNDILEKSVNDVDILCSIIYGPTFTLDHTYNDIYKCVDNFIENGDKPYLVFTANNSVRDKPPMISKRIRYSNSLESHYQTFIIDRIKKAVVIIDPSRNGKNPGIYNPYIGNKLSSFFEGLDLKVNWLFLTSPCQTEYHDVFCQSWSLILAIKWFEWSGLRDNVFIPKDQDLKYSLLLDFFKQFLKYSNFNDELIISYKESIKDHKDYNKLIKYSPCKVLSDMKCEDMY